jgi:hypothetical protein
MYSYTIFGTIQDASCGPITEISDAYEGILKVIREETIDSAAAALIRNSTILNPAIAAIRSRCKRIPWKIIYITRLY